MPRTLYIQSHYQGSTPDFLGTVPDGMNESALIDALTTCSFCAPGRTSNYSTGECYGVQTTRKDYGPIDDELLDRAGL